MTTPPREHLRIALVGAGSVGTAVAGLLKGRGHDVTGVASRSEASARAAAVRLGAGVFDQTVGAAADLVLLGVPEPEIGAASADVARWVAGDTVVVHFAGSAGVGPLDPVVSAGAIGCALHPVQACPDVDTAMARLPGSAWGVTCRDDIRGWCHDLVRADLEGFPVDVAEGDRLVWHAAAVSTSNAIAALMAVGESLLRSIDVGAPGLVLGPIAAGTVANVREAGDAARALTGPVVRGERSSIERHARAIAASSPDVLAAYLHAGHVVLHVARSSGRLDPETAAAIERTLEEARTWR